jgi:Bacteriocin-protection, YdeI or OmpD-Associated
VQPQRYTATLAAGSRGRLFVPVPFDPDQVWRPKPRHHITGTVNGAGIRAVIEIHNGQRGFTLGPAWLRDCRAAAVGHTATVEILPEGPQRDDLADDIAAALDANPTAAAFFDSLAQFYRKAYLRWIDATKRHPDLRAQRITEMIQLLDAGIKQRPPGVEADSM